MLYTVTAMLYHNICIAEKGREKETRRKLPKAIIVKRLGDEFILGQSGCFVRQPFDLDTKAVTLPIDRQTVEDLVLLIDKKVIPQLAVDRIQAWMSQVL